MTDHSIVGCHFGIEAGQKYLSRSHWRSLIRYQDATVRHEMRTHPSARSQCRNERARCAPCTIETVRTQASGYRPWLPAAGDTADEPEAGEQHGEFSRFRNRHGDELILTRPLSRTLNCH